MIRFTNTLSSKPSLRRWSKGPFAVPRSICMWSVILSLLTPMIANALPLEVELEWKPNEEPDLAGYRLHFGTESGKYTDEINVGKNKTSATVGDLDQGKTYFFALSAYNNLGLESRSSHEIEYPSPDHVRNLSTRGPVHLDGVLISGFVITGNGQKKVLIRALGPSVPVPGFLADPVLEVHDISGRTIATNDNWRNGGDEDAILATGLAPLSYKDAAVILTLDAGPYTIVLRDGEGGTGVGLAEIYDLDDSRDTLRLSNSSARGSVLSGDNILIGGFVIEAGEHRTKILSRALGPSLVKFDVPYVLGDPILQLYDGNGTMIASNDDWKDTQQEQIEAIGIAPPDNRESAILATLSPGHYTAIVSGKNGAMGIGLVEFYSLLSPDTTQAPPDQ
jgi:hypothetical protein